MITLRDFTIEDTERLVEVLNDCEVTRFLSTKIPSPYTHSDAEWWILQCAYFCDVKGREI